jgi:Tfp pilus assembly protein PilV
MKKKPMVLLTICILFVAVASLLLYTLRPTGQAQKQNPTLTSTNSLVEDYASIGEILQDPSAWVNKTVVVEGNLSGFFLYSPEDMDWSYKLSSDEWTIGVAHIRERARYPYPFWHGGRYYIEAEKIELL